jgi:hypothetical protein
VKITKLNRLMRLKLKGLRAIEGDGITCVGVKSADIGKKAGGEADLLG